MDATQSLSRVVSLWSSQPTGRRFGLAAAVLLMYVVLNNIGASIIATAAGYHGAIGQVFVLSMTPGYTPAHAASLLGSLGVSGRSADRLTLIAFDVLFPMVYATALSFGLRWAARGAGLGPRSVTTLGVLPIVGAVANWLADIAIIAIISTYPGSSPSLGLAASTLTTVKLAVIGCSAAVIAVLGIIGGLRYLLGSWRSVGTEG